MKGREQAQRAAFTGHNRRVSFRAIHTTPDTKSALVEVGLISWGPCSPLPADDLQPKRPDRRRQALCDAFGAAEIMCRMAHLRELFEIDTRRNAGLRSRKVGHKGVPFPHLLAHPWLFMPPPKASPSRKPCRPGSGAGSGRHTVRGCARRVTMRGGGAPPPDVGAGPTPAAMTCSTQSAALPSRMGTCGQDWGFGGAAASLYAAAHSGATQRVPRQCP